MIDIDTAISLLTLDPETGKMFWNERPRSMFSHARFHKLWNTRYSGREAFTCVDKTNGYRTGHLLGRKILAHRVCWLLHTGKWPAGEIDHIDGDRTNNSVANLRDVTRASNTRNNAMRSNNRSGVNGVFYIAKNKNWSCSICVDGHQKHLGIFKTIEEATAARLAANEKFGFSERHGRDESGLLKFGGC